MKKIIMALFMLSFFIGTAFALEPMMDSRAYKMYQKRASTELSKLIYLLDRFNVEETEIQMGGNIYAAEKAFPYGKSYLAKNYKKEKAEDWLNEHCYRTKESREIIYIRFGDEKFRPFRDVLVEELGRLNKL